MDNKQYFDKMGSAPASLFDFATGHDNSNERYTGMEVIGQGTIKEIHRVLDLTSGRPVAMATPQKGLTKDQVQHFLEEARLTTSLEHPNIIQVFDLGFREDGLPYFTMKLCDSKKLSDILTTENDRLFELLDIFLKICDAMAYAHSVGTVHRDLKPENILLGGFGEVFVSDWGSAQILPGSILETDVGQLSKPLTKGTPGFMSPEQEGSPASIAQDIYSLGVILYSMLTGLSPDAVNMKKPTEIKATIPTGLEAICLKAMAEKPDDRYESTVALTKDIKAWLAGFSPAAEDASFLTQTKLLIVRHKTLSLSIISSLVIITILSFSYISSLKVKEKETRSAKEKAEEALELYDLEKESRERIAKIGADYFIQQANQLVSAMQRDMAKKILDSIPAKELDEVKIRKINAIYGRIYVYKQQFSKALDHLKNAQGYDHNFMLKIAKKYAEIKPNDAEMLTTDQTLEILDTLNNFDIHHAHCFYRDQVLRIPDYEAQVPLIKKMIIVNNMWLEDVNISLTKTGGEYHLDLSNNPKMKVMVPVREMPLTSLNLSNSPIKQQFYVLHNMPLKELNLANCGLRNYNFLEDLHHLEKLILNEKESKSKTLDPFRGRIKIIIQN
ncbi:MAG: serine/threonine protein kinase [Lentisphaeraceae bacterium]|nr:serine/threonine protein kinase [Lentisphaeraceae bacterium]